MNLFGFNRRRSRLSRFRRIMQDERQTGAARRFSVQRGGKQTDVSRTRIANLKLVAHRPVSPAVTGDQSVPIQLGKKFSDRLALHPGGGQANQSGRRGVKIQHATGFIRDDDSVFNRVKKRLEEGPLLGEPLNHCLQPFGVEAADPAQNPVKKRRRYRRRTFEIRTF